MILSGDDEKLYELLTEGMEELSQTGTVYVSDRLKSIQVNPAPAVSVGVSLKGELLELTLNSEEMPLEELLDVLASCQEKRRFVRLKSGDFLSMEDNGLTVLSGIQKSLSVSAGAWEQYSDLQQCCRSITMLLWLSKRVSSVIMGNSSAPV